MPEHRHLPVAAAATSSRGRRIPARRPGSTTGRRYRFSPLGADAAALHPPESEDGDHATSPSRSTCPAPISRRVLHADRRRPRRALLRPGGRSDPASTGDGSSMPASSTRSTSCDLSRRRRRLGARRARRRPIAIDPVLGRIACRRTSRSARRRSASPSTTASARRSAAASTTARAASSSRRRRPRAARADRGPRRRSRPRSTRCRRPASSRSPTTAATRRRSPIAVARRPRRSSSAPPTVRPTLALGRRPRASRGGADAQRHPQRPARRRRRAARPGRRRQRAAPTAACATARSCPGASSTRTARPPSPDEPSSIVVDQPGVDRRARPLHRRPDPASRDGATRRASRDSIVDAATPSRGSRLRRSPTPRPAASARRRADARSTRTVIGKVAAERFDVASNSHLPAPARRPCRVVPSGARRAACASASCPAARSRRGAIRCQPQLAIDEAIAAAPRPRRPVPAAERDAIGVRETWLVPSFTARRYGRPAYGQLRATAPREIRTGADDESEMGAFHLALRAAARDQPAHPPRRVPPLRRSRRGSSTRPEAEEPDHERRLQPHELRRPCATSRASSCSRARPASTRTGTSWSPSSSGAFGPRRARHDRPRRGAASETPDGFQIVAAAGAAADDRPRPDVRRRPARREPRRRRRLEPVIDRTSPRADAAPRACWTRRSPVRRQP